MRIRHFPQESLQLGRSQIKDGGQASMALRQYRLLHPVRIARSQSVQKLIGRA